MESVPAFDSKSIEVMLTAREMETTHKSGAESLTLPISSRTINKMIALTVKNRAI